MFSFHQAAAQFAPAFLRCDVCTGTCYDTCWGGSCGWSGGGCGFMSCDVGNTRGGCGASTVLQALLIGQMGGGDPLEQLGELRKRLESTLAGLAAQEQAIRDRSAGGKGT
jgi:hypothetical protein